MSLSAPPSSFPHHRTEKRSRLEPVHLLYDERMLLHAPVGWVEPDEYPEYLDEVDDDYQLEVPERLRVIYDRLRDLEGRLLYEEDIYMCRQTDTVFSPLACEMATKEQILFAHSEELFDRLDRLQYCTDEELLAMTNKHKNDMYYCRESFNAARLAAGGLLACVDAVCCPTTTTAGDGSSSKAPCKSNKAIALVRPPGHHACQSKEMGFCFIDSVVVAAKYALATKTAKRVAILDWDIHDGNGTSELTIKDENIFRLDIHRYNPREGFYPFTGPPSEIGTGNARGLNLNMAWRHGGMGNSEYAAAFYELILPLLADYKPDLLIISCGLDAAMGDLIGGCDLTPGFFHAMTRAALEAVGPETPVVCALEGGYTMNVIPDCMEAVALGMLNCPFQYHSSFLFESLCGAAEEGATWPSDDALERSRRVLSNYYVRSDLCTALIDSAVQDINRCIRIFGGVDRWKHLHLERIRGPPVETVRVRSEMGGLSWSGGAAFKRPRIYLWYGMEKHHKKFW